MDKRQIKLIALNSNCTNSCPVATRVCVFRDTTFTLYAGDSVARILLNMTENTAL